MATSLATGVALFAPAASNAATTLSPSSLTFPNQQTGTTSSPLSMTLTHTCDGPALQCQVMGSIFAPSVSATPPFTQTNNCPIQLFAQLNPVSCTINVSFTPTTAGAASGTLSTGVGGPTGALTGTGVAPATATIPPAPKKCKKKKGKNGAAAAKKCKRKRGK
jgi:hypothetical protein